MSEIDTIKQAVGEGSQSYQKLPTLGEKVDKLTALVEGKAKEERKTKTFKMPMAGKINNMRLKNGFTTVIQIAENDAVSFTREEIKEGTIRLADTFHAVDDSDVLTYKGKPCLIIPKKSKYPFNPNRTKDTTYSQKHIMSRMMNETISGAKKKIGIGVGAIFGAIIIGIVLYAFLAG